MLRTMKIGLDGQSWQLGQMLRGELFPGYLDFDRESAIKKLLLNNWWLLHKIYFLMKAMF